MKFPAFDKCVQIFKTNFLIILYLGVGSMLQHKGTVTLESERLRLRRFTEEYNAIALYKVKL